MSYDWFTNYGAYKTLHCCMAGDGFWVNALLLLSGAVLLGYLVIAYYWYMNQKQAADTSGKRMLNLLIQIFVFCAFCGYGFTLVNNWWPARRLQVFALVFLNIATWRYVSRLARAAVACSFAAFTARPRRICATAR